MRRVVVGVLGVWFGAAACGGSTNTSKSQGGAAGDVASVGSQSGVAGSASTPGSAGSGGAASPAEAGQAGESSPPLGTGIAAEALEGCRGPTDPGCEVCYFPSGDGDCTRESGGTSEYLDYVGLGEPCPAGGPLCASCSYAYERSLRALGERPDCTCGSGDGTAPCPPNSESCGCYCNAFHRFSRVCPPQQ